MNNSSTFKHSVIGQSILDLVKKLAVNSKWTITTESQKSLSALTHMDSIDPSLVNAVYILWFDNKDKALLTLDVNYWKSKAITQSDHIEIEITTAEANRIANAIEENCIVNWSRSGLEIPEVEAA